MKGNTTVTVIGLTSCLKAHLEISIEVKRYFIIKSGELAKHALTRHSPKKGVNFGCF